MAITVASDTVLRVVWFIDKKGQLDEIELRDWTLEAANGMALNLGVSAYIRRTGHDIETGLWRWSVYRTATARTEIAPRKSFTSAEITQAHMYAIMTGMCV